MHMMIIKSTCINIVLLTFSESTLAKSENLPYKDVDELGLMEKGLVVEYPWLDFVSDIFFFKVFIVSQVNLGIWCFRFSSD